MVESFDIEQMLENKRAGLERMKARQQRVHSRLAEFVESHPGVIESGLSKVRDQLKRPFCAARGVYLEWEKILKNGSVAEVAALLRDTSPDTEQLRACAPFSLCQ
ncbi:hypothetical protein [Rubritalea marina]|uniref:hypothetical protein n=1 Tax=Rubritalea marina TaxID=361055 RepID=UPI00035C40B4|nr:hypothetical protein [Rubritalea marina]